MGVVIEWVGNCLLAAAGAAVLLIFGLLTLWLAGMRPARALIFALPTGAGVFVAITLICGFAGIPWSWWPPGIGLGLLLLACAGKWYFRGRRGNGGEPNEAKRNRDDLELEKTRVEAPRVALSRILPPATLPYQRGTVLFWLGGIAGFAACQLVIFAQGALDPDSLPLYGDAQFHLSALQVIYEGQNVNPIESLIPLYGWEKDTSSYYPVGWHALAVLFMTSPDSVVVNNAMAWMIGAILWPASLGALGVAAFPRDSRWMAFLTPLVALPIVVFPGVMCYGFSVYPFAMAVALLPGAVGMVLEWQRHRRLRRPRAAWILGLIFCVIGSVGLQPSVTLSLLLAIAMVLGVQMVAALPKWFRRGGAARARAFWIPAVVVLAVISVGVALPHVSYVQKLDEFERPALGYAAMFQGLWDGTFAVTLPWIWWKVILAAAIVGLLALLGKRTGWSLAAIGAAWFLLYWASCGEDGYWRMLTGPWYKDYLRLCIPLFALIAVGAAALASRIIVAIEDWGWVRRHRLDRLAQRSFAPQAGVQSSAHPASQTPTPGWVRRLLPLVAAYLACALVTVLALQYFRSTRQVSVDYTAMNYTLSQTTTSQLDADEAALLSQLDDYLEPGSKVFGDPQTGVGYARILSSHSSYIGIPTITQNLSLDQWRLVEYFADWETNEIVCEIIRANDIEGLITNAEIPESRVNDYGSVLRTDLSNGFELLAQEGNAQLWRITGCN